MAYEAPTINQFMGRFPEFEGTPLAAIQLVLSETASFVGTNWLEEDYATARMYLAAHMLVSSGSKGGATVGGVEVEGRVSSVTVGDVRVQFGNRTSSAARGDADLATTHYGQRFLALRTRNIIPVIAVRP